MILKIISIVLFIFFIRCSTPAEKKSFFESSEFETRYNMTYDRLTSDTFHPVFSESFILADVQISPDNPRRFNEYSGDLSGRYIEALSLAAKEKDIEFLHKIVKETLKYQKSDGRFGDGDLDFQQLDIQGEHMALLWGNGRMLVGLLAYYDRFQDKEVLKAAVRLGDFYLTVFDACARPETIQKLDGFGAMGIICFTQYIEGMVRLAEITGDEKYIESCKMVYPLLPARKQQHTHGYLTTLRGVLMLYEYTNEKEHLEYVIDHFNDLLKSTDYTIFGSVAEYFGGKGMRDEGCATSDFVRLGMELYHLTGDLKYLETAEIALFNAFYFNQYNTGDFGHHVLTPNPSKYIPSSPHSNPVKFNGASGSSPMAAWWCCTMHGMRCFTYIKNQMVEIKGDGVYLNLFVETEYESDDFYIITSQVLSNEFPVLFQIKFIKITDKKIYIRKPEWINQIDIFKNGQNVEYSIVDKYIIFNESIKSEDVIQIGLGLRTCLSTIIDCETVHDSRFTGLLKYGPYLMGIDDDIDPTYTAEPNNNQVIFPTIKIPENYIIYKGFKKPLYQTADYHHGGFPSTLQTTFRPIKDLAFEKRATLLLEMDFIKE